MSRKTKVNGDPPSEAGDPTKPNEPVPSRIVVDDDGSVYIPVDDQPGRIEGPAKAKRRRRGRRSLGVIRERAGGWLTIDIQHESIRIRRSAKTKDREVAKRLLVKMLTDIEAGTFGAAPRALSFADLVELLRSDYKHRRLRSWGRAERSIKHLKKTFGSLPAAAITRKMISDYMTKRSDAGAKSGTIRADCAYLGRMLKLACADGGLRAMPVFPTLPTSPARQGVLSEEQVMAVIAALPQPVADLVHMLWLTGWRKKEVQFLPWSDVDMAAGEIRLVEERSKTGDPRVLPFAAIPSLALIIKGRYLARGAGSVHVFEYAPGAPVLDFRRAWVAACKAAGVGARLVHDLRRSRATHLARLGVSERVIMTLAGWRSRAMLDRYNIISGSDLADALARVESKRSVSNPSQSGAGAGDVEDTRSA